MKYCVWYSSCYADTGDMTSCLDCISVWYAVCPCMYLLCTIQHMPTVPCLGFPRGHCQQYSHFVLISLHIMSIHMCGVIACLMHMMSENSDQLAYWKFFVFFLTTKLVIFNRLSEWKSLGKWQHIMPSVMMKTHSLLHIHRVCSQWLTRLPQWSVVACDNIVIRMLFCKSLYTTVPTYSCGHWWIGRWSREPTLIRVARLLGVHRTTFPCVIL